MEFTRTDEESLEIKAISEIARTDTNFDMESIIAANRTELDRYKPMNDWLLVVEDMSPRNPGLVIPVKKRYYQFKGQIVAAGPKVQSSTLKPGQYIVWGLYNGKYVDIATGISTWFVREMHVLGACQPDDRLSE